MADYFTIPANRVHVLPDDVDYRAAALIEPLSTPVHAVRLAGDVRDKAVVILGAGTIGLLVLAVVRAHGAKRVVVTDPLPAKRDRALRLDADVALDATADDIVASPAPPSARAPTSYSTASPSSPRFAQAVAMASKGGTVVIVGVPTGDVPVPLAIVQDHQIRIQGSATYLPEDYDESIRLLVDGKVDIDEIVTAASADDPSRRRLCTVVGRRTRESACRRG